MNRNELDQYLEIIKRVLLNSAVKINEWRESFMHEMLLLYLIIPGRINFLQLGCYGRLDEQRYRQQFERKCDRLSFNACLADSHTDNLVAIAFDPSYISKSSKCTPYLGRFWSGCAKSTKHGLEISGIGFIDVDLHNCFHLEAVQTGKNTGASQVDTNRLVFACVTKPQGNTSTVDQPCGGQCLFLQIIFCGWRPGYGIICNQSFSR